MPVTSPRAEPSILLGPKVIGGYVPTSDQIAAIGGLFTFEIRNSFSQTQLIAGPLYATSLKSNTTLLTLGGTWNVRLARVFAMGLGAAFGYRWTTGNTYTQDGTTYQGSDSEALYGDILLTPVLLTFGPVEIEGTIFIGHDLSTPSNNAPTVWQPGGYLGVAYMFGVGRR